MLLLSSSTEGLPSSAVLQNSFSLAGRDSCHLEGKLAEDCIFHHNEQLPQSCGSSRHWPSRPLPLCSPPSAGLHLASAPSASLAPLPPWAAS